MVHHSPKAQGAYNVVNNVRICAKIKYLKQKLGLGHIKFVACNFIVRFMPALLTNHKTESLDKVCYCTY